MAGGQGSSKKDPINLKRNDALSPDMKGIKSSSVVDYEFSLKQLAYGNLGPYASARVPDSNSEKASDTAGGGASAASGGSHETSVNVAPPKKGNPTPGGGW